MPDAEHFECVDEVLHAHTILKRGTSAHRQIDVYDAAKAKGASEQRSPEGRGRRFGQGNRDRCLNR